mmetsp:Transcript_27909/g.85656  ORF Transcript_27909/g.85656 Transcript_27909/m.85656 type:complete len:120 (+) Transcript_27909:82-441(+)
MMNAGKMQWGGAASEERGAGLVAGNYIGNKAADGGRVVSSNYSEGPRIEERTTEKMSSAGRRGCAVAHKDGSLHGGGVYSQRPVFVLHVPPEAQNSVAALAPERGAMRMSRNCAWWAYM